MKTEQWYMLNQHCFHIATMSQWQWCGSCWQHVHLELKGCVSFGHLSKCVTTSPLPWLSKEGAQTWTGHNHIYCLLCLVPFQLLGLFTSCNFRGGKKTFQFFIMGLYGAMYKVGASQHCCNISKEGLINRLGRWPWTKQQCDSGNIVNKEKTQTIKQNLFLLWGIFSYRKK